VGEIKTKANLKNHLIVIVDDYLIPKGATLLCSMDKIHRSEAFYPRANEFVPDRFMNDPKLMNTAANGKIHERDQFNFGFGRRICPGIYLVRYFLYINIQLY
jgi:cytochrome P450